jgi:1,2-diacylglycerol 3-alpha-glucosyltransferase
MTTIAVIFTNYGPYHLARLEALYRQAKLKGWKVVGIELSRTEQKYPWKADVSALACPFISVFEQPLETISVRQFARQLPEVLSKVSPDVLAIAGYAHPGILTALLWGIWHRKVRILMSASKESDTQRSSIKELPKRWLIDRYHAGLVGGKPQAQYLAKLGMSQNRIFCGYNVVDNQAFHPQMIRSLANPIQNPFFLAINRFVAKKNIPNLIEAYGAYCEQAGSEAWDLVLCGDGKLRSQIEQRIAELKLQHKVHLPGFLQQEQLLPYFAHAGCFVHASLQEQWGLVVNEAMAAGLPVLVSDRCGCYSDLVIEGVNGFGFDPERVDQLTEQLLKMSSELIDREAMGKAALAHIQNFSPDRFADSLLQATEQCLSVV